MDQDQFRSTYHEYNRRNCVFEKSILTNECDCSRVERFCIAEREGAHCRSEAARMQCVEFLEVLRKESRFALRTNQEKGVLPHGKAIKIQVGGLRGVQTILSGGQTPPSKIVDVYEILSTALLKFGSFDQLPLSRIMQHISAHKTRVRSRRKNRVNPGEPD